MKAKTKKARTERIDDVIKKLVNSPNPTESKPFGMRAAPIEPLLAGVEEAQIVTGISKWTWRQLAYRRKIESVKIGARLLIPISEIYRVMEEGRRTRIDDDSAAIVRSRVKVISQHA